MWIQANWPAATHVHAVSTTRVGGFSFAPYDSLNLAMHVGDQPELVEKNRRELTKALSIPSAPIWLRQVHGAAVVEANDGNLGKDADGSYTHCSDIVCAVLTADCLPVFLCDNAGQQIAVLHAGWKGLHAGVIASCIKEFASPHESIMAWLGPAIGPEAFEVGNDVYTAFTLIDDSFAECFVPCAENKWLADIYALATRLLNRSGVTSIYGGGYCTYTESDKYFSYRRDGQCGRMASLIWMDADKK
jgi:YfiH family protein